MDSSDAIQFLILIILICLSAFFSSAETSMTTVNKIRIQALADQGDKRALTLLNVIEDSGKLLSTILIGNNIVNISASSLATTLTMCCRKYQYGYYYSSGLNLWGNHSKNSGNCTFRKNGTVLRKSHSHFNVHSDADYLYYQ